MSKKYFSKIGTTLAIIYILTSGGIWLYTQFCHSDWCGIATLVILLFTIVPWQNLLNLDNVPIAIVISQILNVLILYSIGFFVKKLISIKKKKKSNSLVLKTNQGDIVKR